METTEVPITPTVQAEVRHHGPDSWTVAITINGIERVGVIYDAESDPRRTEDGSGRDPLLVVWNDQGDCVTEDTGFDGFPLARFMPGASGSRIDMQAVCDLLRDDGIPAYVEQTGGGCATIYAGQPYADPNEAGCKRYPVIAGPGIFEGPGWTLPVADTADFYVGPDGDGATEPTTVITNEPATIAALIAERIRAM